MCAAFDEKNARLYVSLSQIFKIFFVPFYSAHVNLTTVLDLIDIPLLGTDSSAPTKYYIEQQNDLYQVNDWIKFALPGFWVLWWVAQLVGTFLSIVGAIALSSVTVARQKKSRALQKTVDFKWD